MCIECKIKFMKKIWRVTHNTLFFNKHFWEDNIIVYRCESLIAIFLANVNLQTFNSDYHLYPIYYTIVWFSLYGEKNIVNELLTSVTDRKYILPFINLFHQLFYVELSLPEVTISGEQTQCEIGGKSKISSLKQISYW